MKRFHLGMFRTLCYQILDPFRTKMSMTAFGVHLPDFITSDIPFSYHQELLVFYIIFSLDIIE